MAAPKPTTAKVKKTTGTLLKSKFGNGEKVTSIGKSKNSRPDRKKTNSKRGVKAYRGQGK